VHRPEEATDTEEAEEENDDPGLKQARTQWKLDNPGLTLKEQRQLLERGVIDHLPWEDYLVDQSINSKFSFGREFPADAAKGDLFINTQIVPTQLYKFNGDRWIQIDKSNTDQYAYDNAYIDHLISAISAGEYDPDLLTTAEQQEIELKLNKNT
jgi:hypothetical protein